MKKTILFPLFAIVVSASAQEGSDLNPKSDSIPKFKRNEISVNIAPAFKMLLGSTRSDATRFSATYKRNLSSKAALRLSLVADNITSFDNMNIESETIIWQTDSVQIIKERIVAPNYWSPHVNLGYERHFGKHKLMWFYGGDVLVGYSQSHLHKERIMFVKDTLLDPNAWVEYETLQMDVVSKSDKKTFSIGLTPFFGAKYPISKRFSISAQVGVDMSYQKSEVTETEGSITRKLNYSTFDFNQNTGLLNDISLVYKF